MLSLFGQLSLIFALIFTLLQSILPMIGFRYQNPYLLAVARPAAWGQFILVVSAYLLLTYAFITDNFSIVYVAQNSHPSLPFLYKLTAIWGAHEGSILLWIVVLSAWTIALSWFSSSFLLLTLTRSVLGFISLCFLIFLLLTSNPFLSSANSASSFDLNPLLQDPGFVIHPPMLYIGYVGFSVAFALTLASLLLNKLDKEWARITKATSLCAWCFLTLGITLGSWWAYRVLGWGGFWFWDPVENASLLPWLTGTALIHVLLLVEKRDSAKIWAALLAIIVFILSVLGTFLVRSGVLVSAHTFASDPARGVFLLMLLTCLSSAALFIYLTRLPKISNTKIYFSFTSRENMLLLNSGLLIIAMLTILLGTLYPLIVDALHLGLISVGAPYFNTVMMPIVLIIMAFMSYGAYSQWQKPLNKKILRQFLKNFLLCALSASILLWSIDGHISVIALITVLLSFAIILSVFPYFRTQPGMALAHLGFAILILGVMLSSLLNQQREVKIKPGDGALLGPYQFFFIDIQRANGSNYQGLRADFEVLKNAKHITNLYPEKRIYPVRQMVMSKVDIHPSIFRDLYIALGEPMEGNYWSVRLYYKPFVRWIWFGGGIMMLGGLLTLRKKSYP